MKESAVKNFMSGYSCSEAVVKAAADAGLVNRDLIAVASSFSGGMQSGCVCGAVAGAQIVSGALFGRHDSSDSREKSATASKKITEDFKSAHKVTCCKVLSAGFEHGSPERKQNCCKFVEFCAGLVEEIAAQNVAK